MDKVCLSASIFPDTVCVNAENTPNRSRNYDPPSLNRNVLEGHQHKTVETLGIFGNGYTVSYGSA